MAAAPPWTRRDFVAGLTSAAAALSAPRWLGAKTPPRVVVLGAGLAGLYAARKLERAGCEVTVLEARQQVGGRLRTLRDFAHSVEEGATLAGSSYRRLLELADELGVAVEPLTGGGSGTAVYVGGQLYEASHWRKLGLHESESTIPVTRLRSHYLGQDVPLKKPDDWLRPEYAAVDQQSIASLMRQRGASDAAIRLADVRPNCDSLSSASALWSLRTMQRQRADGGRPLVFPDGIDEIPKRLAATLASPVLTGREATSLSVGGDAAIVICRDGSTYRADFAISTLPYSVLRRLRVDPPFEGPLATAVRELPYTRITRIFFEITRPYWKEDGLPPSMWTDSPVEQLFALSDASGKPWGLSAWSDAGDADQLDAMEADELAESVTAELVRLRPSTRGAIRVGAVTSWAQDPYALGAYHHFQVGQITDFAKEMARPWHRLHLAGEHTSVSSPGMEGALESGERAAAEVLARLTASQRVARGLSPRISQPRRGDIV